MTISEKNVAQELKRLVDKKIREFGKTAAPDAVDIYGFRVTASTLSSILKSSLK